MTQEQISADTEENTDTALDETTLRGAIEAILFAAGEAVSLSVIADATGAAPDVCRDTLSAMQSAYDFERRGMRIVRLENKYQMLSRREYFEYIKRVIRNSATASLSQAALETLSIVAYKQPVARADIEYIRGVQSSSSLDLLIDRGLVRPSGKLDVPGKPTSFITTAEFLKFMNIEKLSDLPEYDEFAGGIQLKIEEENGSAQDEETDTAEG